MKRNERGDLAVRFVVGGSVLVVVYVLSAVLPWKSFAGVFAAFPGVMAAAVGLSGWRQGSKAASEVARGSVIGMVGCLACVLVSLLALPTVGFWWAALILGLAAWLLVSLAVHALVNKRGR